jgi:hypothetical protein
MVAQLSYSKKPKLTAAWLNALPLPESTNGFAILF